ncbi:MAG: trimethylamine methyltransferase family protein [Actinomycetota bacterium]
MSDGPRRRRSATRTGRRDRSRSARSQTRFSQPSRPFAPTSIVSPDEVEQIHDASLRVLRDVGIDMLHEGIRRRLADAGATVEGERVRFDPAMVEEFVALAPASFTLHGRTSERDLQIGGGPVTFSSVASAPNYVDLDGRRRTGDRAGYQDFLRLGHMLPAVHTFAGYPVEPVDVHASIRHLEAAYDAHTLTDRSFHVYSLGAQRNLDGIEMVRIARGLSDDDLDRQPSISTIINASSPLRYDAPMLGGIVEMSSRNQVVIITPFTLAGAMAPITIAGALVQQNAEALAGITVTQVVRAGSPVIYGGFTSNVDMRSGSPAFGTPEYAKACLVGGQLARRYGVPYRSSAVSASNAVDAQAGYETMWALWGAIMGGADFVMHGAGWMEGGLHASYEKMVVDADLLNMVSAFLAPLEITDDSLAVDAIAGVGPAGHFFGEAHTQARYETEFYSPLVSDWRNWESWTEAGSPWADGRANTVARALLADYEPPPLDDAIRAELRDFVDRRIAEGGVATDY